MIVVSLLSFLAVFFIVYRLYRAQSLRLKAVRHGCLPAPRYHHVDPIFGLDIFLRSGDAMAKNRVLDEQQRRYDHYGPTFEALNFGAKAIYSVQKENIQAVWSKNAADWGIQPLRLHTMHSFAGIGFITTDGAKWKHSHDLLKPSFHKSNISDFEPIEEHLQLVLNQIPKDGSKFDLQPWILKMVSHPCPIYNLI